MKKIKIVLLLTLLMLNTQTITNVNAKEEKETVTFSSCVDGDTAKVKLKNEIVTVRMIAIDTPETKHPTIGAEPWGKEASNFTCSKLENAKKIEIEYDPNSDKTDKYDRILAWIWVDNELLQDQIIKEGYAEVAYLYDDYKYTALLQDHEAVAKANKKGLWSDETPQTTESNNKDKTNETEETTNYIYLILAIVAIIIIYAFGSKSTKKKIKTKLKNKIKKEIQSSLK